MLENIKAVSIDLDGTLLKSDGTVGQETVDCLKECKRRGLTL
ncbi:HAD hydrolase family protein [Terrimonas pollutisoli]